MRKQIIVGNWKMFKTNEQGVQFIKNVEAKLKANPNMIVGVAAPTVMLSDLTKVAKNIKIAAQNCYFEKEGAFTGETSIPMLQAINVNYVVIGHSERRDIFGECDQMINSKVKALVAANFTPILCCGESLEIYEAKKTMAHVAEQLTQDLAGVTAEQMSQVVIAYEPIWAIGTGKVATPEIAQEICQGIRQHIAKLYNQAVANEVLIQYGGSVKPENIKDILSQPDIDGALVGGASLIEDSYLGLVQ
ncbi:triosephosphate isomerase [Spiroplasma clarkii]|uniref:Triosephosphate isomerase n=1 Tax=Spiroplasma clarkii TaxID=2139 RepID=A0A1Y0L2C3_9MOLU|nr:triose-phosphate isomerase [Spiroplasma clarkii]ARU92161.1 triosephosphate isomerase [Spiroplasma clarkii]ATX71493.1 triosephosphate isomerase [Spiroplasma clarkii]